jgi:lysozyme
MKLSDKARKITEHFEQGPELNGRPALFPYDDATGDYVNKGDKVHGKLTVGFGHVVKPTDKFEYPLTPEFCHKLLDEEIEQAERAVNRNVKVKLAQGQFDALVLFIYNCGETNFRASTLLKLVNMNKFEEAANQFKRWVYATIDGVKVVMAGLIKRRAAEESLFRN